MYKCLYIEKSGKIAWIDVETFDECILISKQEKQQIDVYENCKYLCSLEVL